MVSMQTDIILSNSFCVNKTIYLPILNLNYLVTFATEFGY